MGDYSDQPIAQPIESNTLLGVQTPMAAQVPVMHREKGATRITHREYVCDIGMTVGYTNTQYNINPVNDQLFPWLKYTAAAFSEYSVSGMIFEIKSLAANAVSGTNAGMGSITASVNYDVYANPPASKAESNNAMFAVSCKPSESMMCPVECDPSENPSKILRVGQVGTESSDRHFYSLGNLNISTQGASAAYPAAAELWVTYDLWLYKPVLTGLGNPLMFHQLLNPTTVLPLQPVVSTFNTNTLNAVIQSDNLTILLPSTLEKGSTFILDYHMLGAGTASVRAPAFTFSGGLAPALLYTGGTNSECYPFSYSGGGSSNAVMCSFAFKYNGTGTPLVPPRITCNTAGCTFPTTPVGEIWITEIPKGSIPGFNFTSSPPLELKSDVDMQAIMRRLAQLESKDSVAFSRSSDSVLGCVCSSDSDTIDNRHFICPVHPPSVPPTPSVLTRWR